MPGLEPGLRIKAFTAALAAMAGLFAVLILFTGVAPLGQDFVPWWGIGIGYFLADVLAAHLTLRNQAYTITLSEVPMVLGLVGGSPAALITGGLAGTTLALMLHRRQSPLKIVFNLSTFLVEAGIAILLTRALLDGHSANSAPGWLAALGGTVAASAAGHLLVAAVLLAAATAPPLRQIIRTLVVGLTSAALNSVLGISALRVVQRDPQVAALLVIPCLVLAAAYRSYLSEHQKLRRVRQLFEASGALHRSRGVDAAVATLLSTACEMFNADVSELILLPQGSPGAARRYALSPGAAGVTVGECAPDGIVDLVSRRRAVLLSEDRPGATLMQPSWRGGMAVSVSGEGSVNGLLIVANRRDAVSNFQSNDLELLEAFAGPASVSLENGRLHAELEHGAFHDSLTGLANRALLAQTLQAAITRGPRGKFAVLLLDVDDFKAVNDTLGHPVGDKLLVEIARRLTAALGRGDTAARLGGDEFAVMLRTGPDDRRAMELATRILESLRRPFRIGRCDVTVRASIGIVIDNPTVTAVDDLLGNADIAMYRAKAQGKDRYVVFEPIMHVEVLARHQLRADLEQAIGQGQLRVHYQPIVELATGDVVGAEALVRWPHPVRGAIPPDEFIALAEESGLILPLGHFVLRQACRQLVDWTARHPMLRMSVNISARQLEEAGIVGDILGVLAEYGVDPARINLEVTEHVVVDEERAVTALRELRSFGLRIAIDDFGTGYSSLSCLRHLPIDILKVAKPFTDRLATGDDDRALAMSVLGLAHSLRLDTVAEGIERPDQAEILRAGGCQYGQGFLYSRALPADEFLAYLSRARSPAPVLSLAR